MPLLDRIIVVDLEATCWEACPPDGQVAEIIEIGICTLDPYRGERFDRHGILVRPERSEVSAFCTRLNGITPEAARSGISFAEACALLETQWESRERVWASYGDWDHLQFRRQCDERGVEYPFGVRHVNVRTLFALMHGLPAEVGLRAALERAGLALEGTLHRGCDDAWNTAALLRELLLRGR